MTGAADREGEICGAPRSLEQQLFRRDRSGTARIGATRIDPIGFGPNKAVFRLTDSRSPAGRAT
jgi:hypothetical protein